LACNKKIMKCFCIRRSLITGIIFLKINTFTFRGESFLVRQPSLFKSMENQNDSFRTQQNQRNKKKFRNIAPALKSPVQDTKHSREAESKTTRNSGSRKHIQDDRENSPNRRKRVVLANEKQGEPKKADSAKQTYRRGSNQSGQTVWESSEQRKPKSDKKQISQQRKPSKSGGKAGQKRLSPPVQKSRDDMKEDTKPSKEVDLESFDGSQTISHLTNIEFASLQGISEASKNALINISKYKYLTKVQHATLYSIMEGKDVLAKAKTGTGKTVAFLLPAIEKIASDKSHGVIQNGQISLLVLSPTRELAMQIENEAKELTTYHPIQTECVIGGIAMKKDAKKLSKQNLDILVATPGRILDHLQSNNFNVAQRLSKFKCLVLDEADRLLDMGFRRDLERILSFLPSSRQTLLFSATLPDSLNDIQRLALKKDHSFIDTVGEADHDTNHQVDQEFMLCDIQSQIEQLDALLQSHIQSQKDASRPFKIMVFFPTARMAGFKAQLFKKAGYPVLEIHSRKSQTQRVKIAESFRQGKNLILFSSDVSARGVDYPGVSLIVQVGLTDRDQYIHRLGRTARAGQNGKGVLLICDFEQKLLKELKGLPLVEHQSIPSNENGGPVGNVLKKLERDSQLKESAEKGYQAFLGFYNSNLRRLSLSQQDLVQIAAEYSRAIGLREPPKLYKKTLKKMNLLGTPGLEFQPNPPHPNQQRGKK